MERQASLLLWGPPVLSQWLFENWNNPDNLGDESKRAIRMLSPQHHGSDEEMLRRLVIAFEYERILSALQLEDFERFVESVLESKPELSNYQLEMSLPELRTLLTRTFHRSALWPPQGFISLLQEALGAAAKAVERLPEVDPAMNSLSRQRAIESVHDGMDRALICAERFLELVLEFLTRVAGIATLASSDEVNEWLGHAGINPAGKTEQSQWGDKEAALHEAAYRLWKAKVPTGWEYIFPELNNFAFQCIGCPWGKVEHPVTGQWVPVHDKKKEIRNMEPGEIMRVFEELRKCRNPVRHAARTLQASQDVPEAYRSAARSIFDLLNCLKNFWQQNRGPAVVEVVSYNEDCFGRLELMLAMEGERMVTARFMNRETLNKLGVAKKPAKLIFLRDAFSEFFLFPAPTPEENVVFHPILVEREGLPKRIGDVKLVSLPSEPAVEEEVLSEEVGST